MKKIKKSLKNTEIKSVSRKQLWRIPLVITVIVLIINLLIFWGCGYIPSINKIILFKGASTLVGLPTEINLPFTIYLTWDILAAFVYAFSTILVINFLSSIKKSNFNFLIGWYLFTIAIVILFTILYTLVFFLGISVVISLIVALIVFGLALIIFPSSLAVITAFIIFLLGMVIAFDLKTIIIPEIASGLVFLVIALIAIIPHIMIGVIYICLKLLKLLKIIILWACEK